VSVGDFEGALADVLWVWDLVNGICLYTLQGHSGGVTTANVTQDGRHVISGSEDGSVRVWNMQSGDCIQVLAAGTFVSSAALCRDLFVFGTGTGNVVFTEIRNLHSVPPTAPIPIDTSDSEYGALLQRGLELSIREKGLDHEETVAYRKALAVHLERFGGQRKQ
jgi:WD40 repeat protein